MRGVRVFGALVGLTALVAAGSAAAAGTGVADPPPQADRGLVDARVCGPPTPGSAACHAHVLARPDGHGGVAPNVTSGPTGLRPATVRHAYGFDSIDGTGAEQTIAIVDAYDAPHIEADLAKFSSAFGIPCNGCFTKVNQNGGTAYPRKDPGWALEIALDVEWAHAIAPDAHILLVEATSNSFTNLLIAEDYAKTNGAAYISNSWGAPEFSGETMYDSHFAQQGVSFFVSAGDNGTPAEYPSSSPNVISVGGTTLRLNSDGTVASETGWTDGGGGCSTQASATAAQAAFAGYTALNCNGKRATPDVSLVADPATGVSVYSSDYGRTAGWYVVGGTSASAPMWAARSAVQGAVVNSAYVYASSIPFRDIVDGNNGAPCQLGFDLCTGRGSWADADPTSTGGGTAPPAASISTSCGNTNACTFTLTPTTSSVSWTFGDSTGTLADNSTVDHTYASTGTYSVTATAGTLSAQTTVTCSQKNRRFGLTCK